MVQRLSEKPHDEGLEAWKMADSERERKMSHGFLKKPPEKPVAQAKLNLLTF